MAGTASHGSPDGHIFGRVIAPQRVAGYYVFARSGENMGIGHIFMSDAIRFSARQIGRGHFRYRVTEA